MKIRIWGARGSIPAPIKSQHIEEKLYRAIYGMPSIDTGDPEAVWSYIRSLPQLLRGTAGGNTTCVEIQAGGETFIIDAGSGLRELGLELMKGPCGRGQGRLHLFFTHLHWDHILGFPFFVPAFIPGNQLFIYSIHDAFKALNDQQRPLNFPVSLDDMVATKEFKTIALGEPFQIGPVTINTFENLHPGKAYSYRFEDQHNTFVFASDSEHKQLTGESLQPYVDFFKDADAVIFDAQYTLEDAWHHKVDWGHSSAMVGVDLVRAAQAKKLILFHHDPTCTDTQLEEIRASATAYQAQDPTQPEIDVVIGYEGLVLDLTPPGTVNLQYSDDGKAAILTPTTIFDERGIDQLSRQLAGLTQSDSAASSILDLSQVERLTTASLKSLATLDQVRKGEPIVLAAPSAAVRQVIEIGGFSEFFAIYPSVEAALTAVQARKTLNLPGQLIKDRYQIQAKIGGSNLGTVLKATDTNLNQPVAIKFLSPTLSSETIRRFMRQARQVAALDHRAIVKTIEWGEQQDNYFVVEALTTGRTLQDFLADNELPLSEEQIFDIALNLNPALEHAHNHGVIHGHLTPQNIFLTEDGLKINGFGQGRLAEGHNLLEAPLIRLTAAYLAPEQILGQPLDARIDLYALGVILYRLFTGRLPFEGSDEEIMQAHLHQSPRPPHELNPHIPLSVEHLILKLLAKNPNDRYATAKQVRRVVSSSVSQGGLQATTSLVGRNEQAAQLQRFWTEASAGRGQLVFISGEAGVGKSSLVRQVASKSAAPVLLTGRCNELKGSPPYHPFADLLQTYLATAPPEFYDDDIRKLLGNFVRIVPQIRQMLPDLVEPPPLEPKLEQLRLMTSLTQFVRRATQRRPWFVILEDLQWADPSSLELLRYLCYHLPEMALMIVGAYRDTEVAADHPLLKTLSELSSGPTYHHLGLQRLQLEQVGQLLKNLWQQAVPENFVQMIYRHTEGNPFYIEEIIRGLVDDGTIAEYEGVWHFPVVAQLHLPNSIREAVLRRIRRMSPNTQNLLREAAVLGHQFRFDDLQALSDLSKWALLEHLDLALEQQLVQEVSGQAAFRFSHGEIQNVLYTDLNILRRRLMHLRAGEILERRAATGSDQVVEDLARHFTEAGELERALVYTYRAAQQAQAAFANETALHWYSRTLELLDQIDQTDGRSEAHAMRLSVHRSFGELLALMGKYEEALAQYALARTRLDTQPPSTGQKNQLVSLYQKTAEVYQKQGAYELAFAQLEQGLSYVERTAPSVEAAYAYLAGAVLYLRQGNAQEALSWCQRGLELGMLVRSATGQQAKGRAYYILGNIYSQLGYLAESVEFCQQSVQIYQQLDDRVRQSTALLNLGIAYYERGEWDIASDVYHQSLKIKQEIGDIFGEGQVSNNLANLHMDCGHWDQARDLFEQSLAIWKEIGATGEEANTLSNLAQLHIYLENWEAAHAALKQSMALFARIGSSEFMAELERRWSEYHLRTNNLDLALAYGRRSVERSEQDGDQLEQAMSLRILGLVQWRLGQLEQAECSLQQSLQILIGLKSDFELARTRLALAQLQFSTGYRQQEAHRHLLEATTTFETLKTQPDLERARTLAAKIHRPPPQPNGGSVRGVPYVAFSRLETVS